MTQTIPTGGSPSSKQNLIPQELFDAWTIQRPIKEVLAKMPKPWDILAWVKWAKANLPPDQQPDMPRMEPTKPGRMLATIEKPKNAMERARVWLAKVRPAVEGQCGRRRTYGVACTLVHGFVLGQDEAMKLMAEWNTLCEPPWEVYDLETMIKKAWTSYPRRPRGYAFGFRMHHDSMIEFDESIGDLYSSLDSLDIPMPAHDDLRVPGGDDASDPARLAAQFVNENRTEDGVFKYCIWNGSYYKWNMNHYSEVRSKTIDNKVGHFANRVFEEDFRHAMAAKSPDSKQEITKKKVTTALISAITVLLPEYIEIGNDIKAEPFWRLQPEGIGWDPEDIIVFKDRLLHVPSYIEGKPVYSCPVSPAFFCTRSLKHDFNFGPWQGEHEPPAPWKDYLHSMWDDDPENILCLREVMGSLLVPSTKFQKMFMFEGPPRSGKGTALRVITDMLGPANVCSPTSTSLSGPFGKASLVGKRLAKFVDFRLSTKADRDALVETLLQISGEDDTDIDQKYRDITTMRLSCRFILCFNEIPNFDDNAGALAKRAIILRFKRSFVGREDYDLEKKLKPHTAEITRWAMDGLKSLYERGRFFQPKSGDLSIEEFGNTSSPMSQFITDCLKSDDNFSCSIGKTFNAWKEWCSNQNNRNIGTKNMFSRRLRAAIPGLEVKVARDPDDRTQQNKTFMGIAVDEEKMADVRSSQNFLVSPDITDGRGCPHVADAN
jgi:putative DNA primase/helicase